MAAILFPNIHSPHTGSRDWLGPALQGIYLKGLSEEMKNNFVTQMDIPTEPLAEPKEVSATDGNFE